MFKSNSVVNLEERTWLAQHLRGDKAAFAKLMQAYRKPVYSFLTRYGYDATLSDDIFQDVFIKIHRSAARYDSARPLSPWIFTIVINTMRNYQRNSSANICNIEALSDLADPAANQEQQLHFDQLLHWIQSYLPKLPTQQREALILTTLHGLKLKDVGAILGLPVNTIKTHVRRARLTLTEALGHHQMTELYRQAEGESHGHL